LRICFIGNGLCSHLFKFVKWFSRRGHDVYLFSPFMVDIAGVKTFLVEGNFIYLPKKISMVKSLVKKVNPDIVHAHYIVTSGILGAFSDFHPFVVSPWGSDVFVDPKESIFKNIFVRYALKKADFVSGLGDNMVNNLIRLGCDKKKIIPLRISVVDTTLFNHPHKDISMSKDDFVVVNSRPSLDIYHLDVFIKAIPLVVKKISNIKFVIFLRPSLKLYNNKILSLIKKLNINKFVICKDFIPNSDMPVFLKAVDLFVDSIVSPHSMRDESFTDMNAGIGTSALEAMSSGIPVLLGNKNPVVGHPYMTYYPLDYQDMADKIIEILNNKKIRDILTAQGRRFVINHADINRCLLEWEAFYERCINNS